MLCYVFFFIGEKNGWFGGGLGVVASNGYKWNEDVFFPGNLVAFHRAL